MDIKDQRQSGLNQEHLSMLGLLVMLYLMYSSTFLSDYLINDERAHIGRITLDAVSAMATEFFRKGRGLFGLYQMLIYNFVGYSTARIQFVRFVNFASIALIALVLLRFLQARRGAYFALMVSLFFLSQLPFQGLMGYSLQLISNSQPSIWLSLLAFYLYFFAFERSRLPFPLQAAVVFIILMLAMQSTQTYAFFASIPVAFLALTDWRNKKRRIIGFLIIAFAVLILSMLVYGAGLEVRHIQGEQGYSLGEEGVDQVTGNPMAVITNAFNPLAYWSVFKLWTFPFPLHNTPPISEFREKQMASLVMIGWLGIILGAVYVELKNTIGDMRRDVVFKWLAVLCCFVLAAVFVVADSPSRIVDHRPHVYLTLSGLVIVTGAYGLGVMASKWAFLRSSSVKVAGAALVVMLAFGAQAGVLRNMVDNHRAQIDFMRTELLAKDPNSYQKVLVLVPQWNGCITEPCGPWFGESLPGPGHLRSPEAYRYALATIGIDPSSMKITVVDQLPATVPPDAVVIDWGRYSLAAERSAGYFSRGFDDR